MIVGFAALLVCQLVGVFVVEAFQIPIPGPVLGMLLLLVYLFIRRPTPDAPVARAAETTLRFLPLFFVPAGVGFIAYLATLAGQAVPIVAGLTLSWVIGLVVTAGVGLGLLRLEAQLLGRLAQRRTRNGSAKDPGDSQGGAHK